MKNQILRAIAIFTIFLALAGVSVQAQTASKVEVTIPFEFSVGSKTLQPGVYSIKRMAANLLVLRNRDGKSVILNAPLSVESKDKGERLVFNRRAEKFYLSQVWLSGENGRQLMPTDEKSDRVEIAIRVK